MNEQSITIRWEKNPDGSTYISVSEDIDGYTQNEHNYGGSKTVFNGFNENSQGA